ncbi:MAG: protein translocase subunit SecD [Nocardioidaceae bacterium]
MPASIRPSRAPLWRALASLAVLGLALFFAVTSAPRLGLDLEGGTQIVLETQDGKRVDADRESTDRALEVLRGRVDALGVAEPTLARSGERRIIVELPGVQDPREAADVIGQTAQLGFHVVQGPAGENSADGKQVVADESGQRIVIGPQVLDGNGVGDASAEQEQGGIGGWVVSVSFNGGGAPQWRDLVSQACGNAAGGQRIAILLDDEVISSPAVQPELCSGAGSATQITGGFTQASATDLAVLIKGGALPVPVEVIEQRTVGATLGDAAIDASVEAAVIGLALTGLFIVFVYRLVGLLAALALGCYALISYGILVWLGATLTLPGLAGFVLAIGLAIDANVLVFERAREEYARRRGEGPAAALETGYRKAWSAIIDSNVTTLLAAGLLFFLASGPVKGFGVTLSIGVVASMVSALVVARMLTDLAIRRATPSVVTGLSGHGRLRAWLNESGPFLMRRVGLWLGVAAAIAVVAIGGIFSRGLNLGVEFTGGRLLEFSTSQPVSVERARAAVADAGFPGAVVQASGEDNVTVRTATISNEQAVAIEKSLAAVTGEVTKERDELVGPTLGDELRTKALIAFAIAVGAQMLYLAVRFRWTYAAAAVISMSHVVLTVVGVFAWLGKPVDGVFLAAVLSIIGLAVNDTIVVFDRIREHTRETGGQPLRQAVNAAILQTVPRTVNTGLGAMFILAALALLGGDSLTDFAIALLLGLTVGIYSTVFTASPLAIWTEERWPRSARSPRGRMVDPYADIPAAGREAGHV